LTTQINMVGGEEASRECPNCHSKRKWKDGLRETENGSIQRFICRECRRKFSEKSYKTCLTIGNHQLCAIKKAKKLDNATEIKIVAGESSQREQELKGRFLQFQIAFKNDNKEQVTIESYLKRLKMIAKNSDIDESESVKAYISTKTGQNTKAAYVAAYSAFMRWQGKSWKAPKYSFLTDTRIHTYRRRNRPIDSWLRKEKCNYFTSS